MNNLYLMFGDDGEIMAQTILARICPEKDIKALAKSQPLIGIKPNLVVSQPAEWGATTSPALVRGVIKYLNSMGFSNIIILESSWVGDSTEQAFKECGYLDISEEFDVPLVDLKQDKSKRFEIDGAVIEVCEQALAVDYLINMPVLKAHCQTKLTCALKNLKGCVPDKEKRHFHALGLHHPIAYLNTILRSNLIIVDGIIGDLTYEGGGNPIKMNRVLAAKDPVLLDAYAAELIGYAAEDIKYIGLAERMGVGSSDLHGVDIIQLNRNEDAPADEEILASEETDYLRQWVKDENACSACYGTVIHALQRFKELGKLEKLSDRLHIGQGFKNKQMKGIGVGTCTKGFSHNIKGCPPKAVDVLYFLKEQEKR